MPMPPRPDLRLGRATILGVVAVLAASLVAASPVRGAGDAVARGAVAAWKSAFGERPQAPIGQRVIVVLSAPSLADYVGATQTPPSAVDERRWVAEAEASQRTLVARLGSRGLALKPLRTFTRVVNGFSAVVDARMLAELERTDGVAGVYPVRTVHPASLTSETLARADFRAGGHRPGITLPGFDGAGVTIALLDTGVQSGHPALRGRVLPGIDVLSGGKAAGTRAKPGEPGRLESHGTRMAGLLVGNAAGVQGVATGARVLPIRVLGWQADVGGDYAVFGEGDALLEGLDRAVDPNGDGDSADAAEIALAPLVEPFAAFADSPEARAVTGAARLGTLVVAAAGNDGRAGRDGFGSMGAPGGAADALTVGALDARRRLAEAGVVVRAGGDTLFDSFIRPAGAVAPASAQTLPVAALLGPSLADPGGAAGASAGGTEIADFFDRDGVSTVAGRAVLLPARGDVAAQARNAAAAGASALLISGGRLPAGGLDLDEATALPVLALPAAAGRDTLAALAGGEDVTVTLGASRSVRNPDAGRVAPFSSGGLVFDGRVKPDVVAPGVGLVTADAGPGARIATASGSSAAAAVAAGAAALVAQARPGLSAAELRSLLVGGARGLEAGGDPVTAQGAGLLDPAASAATEVAVEPSSLALGRAPARGWRVLRGVTVRNLSTRRVEIGFGLARDGSGGPDVAFAANPAQLSLGPGESALVILQASAAPGATGAAGGAFVVQPAGSQAVRVPWAVSFRSGKLDRLVGDVVLSNRVFSPSGAAPAVLAFRAGRADEAVDGETIEPVRLLEGELRTAAGKRLGVLFRLRDLLPGRYAFGLTGRGPTGERLRPGDFVLRLRAEPVEGDAGARPSTVDVRFTISG